MDTQDLFSAITAPALALNGAKRSSTSLLAILPDIISLMDPQAEQLLSAGDRVALAVKVKALLQTMTERRLDVTLEDWNLEAHGEQKAKQIVNFRRTNESPEGLHSIFVIPVYTGPGGKLCTVVQHQMRPHAGAHGCLEIPAGKFDEGDISTESTAARELLEETGLVWNHKVDHPIARGGHHYADGGLSNAMGEVLVVPVNPLDKEMTALSEDEKAQGLGQIWDFPLSQIPEYVDYCLSQGLGVMGTFSNIALGMKVQRHVTANEQATAAGGLSQIRDTDYTKTEAFFTAITAPALALVGTKRASVSLLAILPDVISVIDPQAEHLLSAGDRHILAADLKGLLEVMTERRLDVTLEDWTLNAHGDEKAKRIINFRRTNDSPEGLHSVFVFPIYAGPDGKLCTVVQHQLRPHAGVAASLGKFDEGDLSTEATAARELLEETGLVWNHTVDQPIARGGHHYRDGGLTNALGEVLVVPVNPLDKGSTALSDDEKAQGLGQIWDFPLSQIPEYVDCSRVQPHRGACDADTPDCLSQGLGITGTISNIALGMKLQRYVSGNEQAASPERTPHLA